MKTKILILMLVLVFSFGCAVVKGTDGRTYLGYDLTDWEEIDQEMKQAKDPCIKGDRVDCYGDPVGGGPGGK